jgi:hypothetical protein
MRVIWIASGDRLFNGGNISLFWLITRWLPTENDRLLMMDLVDEGATRWLPSAKGKPYSCLHACQKVRLEGSWHTGFDTPYNLWSNFINGWDNPLIASRKCNLKHWVALRFAESNILTFHYTLALYAYQILWPNLLTSSAVLILM